jgi:hypothetical protein
MARGSRTGKLSAASSWMEISGFPNVATHFERQAVEKP